MTHGSECRRASNLQERPHDQQKRRAEALGAMEAKLFERRFHLPQSTPPYFEEWASDFLTKSSRRLSQATPGTFLVVCCVSGGLT